MNSFVFSTPITYTGGDVVVEWCFDNAAYVLGNNYFESTVTPGTMSQYADLISASGCGLSPPLENGRQYEYFTGCPLSSQLHAGITEFA